MKLENFVNAMGINVLQVIRQIDNDNNKNSNRHNQNNRIVNADTFINADWFSQCKKRILLQQQQSNKVKRLASQNLTLSSSRNLSLSETVSDDIRRRMSHLDAKNKFKLASNFIINKTEALVPTSFNNAENSINTLPYISSLGCDPNALIKPITIPLNFPLLSKHSVGKTLSKTSDLRKNINSNVWKRPHGVKWCSSKEFLSKKIKTYDDACKLVTRSNDVIVRTVCNKISDGRNSRNEFISLDDISLESIDFLTPLYI